MCLILVIWQYMFCMVQVCWRVVLVLVTLPCGSSQPWLGPSVNRRTDGNYSHHPRSRALYHSWLWVSKSRNLGMVVKLISWWQLDLIDQSHRYRRPQAACREPAGSYDKTTRTAMCFEHKTQYLLIRALCTHIVVFWHISNMPPMISQSQISCNTPTLYIAAIFVRFCYTTGSWLL